MDMKMIRLIERELYIPEFSDVDIHYFDDCCLPVEQIKSRVHTVVKSEIIWFRFRLRNAICRKDIVNEAIRKLREGKAEVL